MTGDKDNFITIHMEPDGNDMRSTVRTHRSNFPCTCAVKQEGTYFGSDILCFHRKTTFQEKLVSDNITLQWTTYGFRMRETFSGLHILQALFSFSILGRQTSR